jgi:Ca2+-transporting ATPase
MRSIGIFSNKYVYVGIVSIIALQAAYMYVPALTVLFAAAPLTAAQWGWSALVAASVLPIIALDKWFERRSRTKAPAVAAQ